MQKARDFLKIEGDEIINSVDIESLDSENLKALEMLLGIYKDLLTSEQEINKMIMKNQVMQIKIFFFFGGLFVSEIIYSLVIGSGYIESINNIRVLMLVFIMFFMGLAYCVFRK